MALRPEEPISVTRELLAPPGQPPGTRGSSQSHGPAVRAPRPHRPVAPACGLRAPLLPQPRQDEGRRAAADARPSRCASLPPAAPPVWPREADVRGVPRLAWRPPNAPPPSEVSHPAIGALSGVNGRAAAGSRGAEGQGTRRGDTCRSSPGRGARGLPGVGSLPPRATSVAAGRAAPPARLPRSAPGRRRLSCGARYRRRPAPHLAACADGRHFRTGSGQRPAARPLSPVAHRPLVGEPPRSRVSPRLARASCHSVPQEVGSVTSLAAQDSEKRPFVL